MSVASHARSRAGLAKPPKEIHLACLRCDPNKGLCGSPRDADFKPIGTQVTCVVCDSFHRCPNCGGTRR